MDRLPKDKLLHFNPNALVEVRKDAGFDNPEDLNKKIDLLDDWVKKQDHFVKKDFSRGYLERGLITTKGSLEIAKIRLDKMCTIRTMMPEFFEDYDFEKDFIISDLVQVMLPKQTKDFERIVWMRCDKDSTTSSIIHNFCRMCVVMSEYGRSRDYSKKYILVNDISEMNIANFLSKLQFNDLRGAITIFLKGQGTRLQGLHFLTSSKLIDGFVTMLKHILSPKLRQRIHVHKDIESLYEFVPREVIPVEYGGCEEKSLEEIHAEWVKELSSEEFKEDWMEMCRARTDESRRQAGAFNEEYMGMQGSFRTLTVD